LFPLKELHKSMNVEVNRRSSFTFYWIVLSWEGKGKRVLFATNTVIFGLVMVSCEFLRN
jgi:hypothetical protein